MSKQEIRQKAKALLNRDYTLEDLVSDKNLPQIIEELQIHQVELEIQNEELRHAQNELQREKRKFLDLYHSAPVAYFTFDPNGLIMEVNITGAKLLNQSRQILLQKPLAIYLSRNSHETFAIHRQRVLETHIPQSCELVIRKFSAEKNNDQFTLVDVYVETTVAQNDDGDFIYFRSAMIDITERKQIESSLRQAKAHLQYAATHDSLTGLLNRAMLMKHLEKSIQLTKENPTYLFAVLFLDLDRFKFINDSHGHLVGDEFLIAISRRLQQAVQAKHLIARFGGDEFVILLDNLGNIEEAIQTVININRHLAHPIDINGHQIFTTASVGIALNDRQYNQPVELLRDADAAMYQAKNKGRGQYQLFHKVYHQGALANLQMETALWQAIEREEFVLYYQPIIDLATGEVVSLEALLRWQRSSNKFISPEHFLPLAEETGLIVAIDKWVIPTACTQLATWEAEGYSDLKVAVNISASSLHQHDIGPFVAHTLQTTHLASNMLYLEISEKTDWQNVNLQELSLLDQLGVKISLDDFGTGHASLAHLRHLPLSILKLDRSFIMHVGQNPKDEAIVKAMTMLAHSLNLTVIAEGVETKEQLAILQTYQCDQIQGYLVSQPLAAQAIPSFLRERQNFFNHPNFQDS